MWEEFFPNMLKWQFLCFYIAVFTVREEKTKQKQNKTENEKQTKNKQTNKQKTKQKQKNKKYRKK